jgi:hypothetical protein
MQDSVNNVDNIENKPDFELVDPNDFPWLDHVFYEKVSTEFELEGFTHIGDIGFICFWEIIPKTFHRTMTNQDKTIVAEMYHIRHKSFRFLWNFLFGIYPYKSICLTTEFSDGVILYTITGKKAKNKSFVQLPKNMIKQLISPKVGIREIIDAHKEKVRLYLEEHRRVRTLEIGDLQSWLGFQSKVKTTALSDAG